MRASPEIYLDVNAASGLRPEALSALLSLLGGADLDSPLGRGLLLPNPSSTHSFGRQSKKILIEARSRVASSLGGLVRDEEVLFTSSGTESNQTAIRSALEPFFQEKKPVHWITSRVEHDATWSMAEWVEKRGGKTSFLPTDSYGRPDVGGLSELMSEQTRLVSVIWANNETGVLTDVDELAGICARSGIPLHLDGAQIWGKIPLRLKSLGAQWVSFSGQKIGALAGTGVLWHAPEARVTAVIPGKQEAGLRGGTENLLGILSLGAAASTLSDQAILSWSERVGRSRTLIESEAKKTIPGTVLNGEGAPRIANTSNFSFEGIEKPGVVAALDLQGYAVSSGSACSSGVTEPSRVLLAMGHSRGTAASSIRVSLSDEMPENVVKVFVETMAKTVRNQRGS